jgi:transposase
MTHRYALTGAQWERIKDLLPGRAGHVGAPAKGNRLFIDAVLYRYRAGIPWRGLPERFGDFRVVHLRHMRWAIRRAFTLPMGKPRIWMEQMYCSKTSMRRQP